MAYGNVKYSEPGSGTDVRFDDDGSGGKIQAVKLLDATAGSTTPTGTTANPLIIDQQNSAEADFDTGAGTVTQMMVGIALPASGGPVAGGTATDPIRTDPTGTTRQPVNLIVGQTGIDSGPGFSSGATPRVILASDQAALLISQVTPGTGATHLGKAEDAAHASGDTGVMLLGVRTDTTATRTNTDGDYEAVQLKGGRLVVDPSGVTQTITGTVTANAGTGNFTVVATDLDIRNLASGQDSVAAVQSGVWNVTNVSGTISLPTGAATAANQATAITALQLLDNASVDHDAPVVAGVTQIGLEARSSAPTAVANGDAVRALATLLGKQVTCAYAIPASTWSYAAASGGITNTTGVTAKAAAGSGVRNYITRAQVINGHASVSTDVQIRDGASGTVLWRGWAQAAGGGVTCVFDPPLRGSANTLVEVACGTGGAAVYVDLQGFVAAE